MLCCHIISISCSELVVLCYIGYLSTFTLWPACGFYSCEFLFPRSAITLIANMRSSIGPAVLFNGSDLSLLQDNLPLDKA